MASWSCTAVSRSFQEIAIACRAQTSFPVQSIPIGYVNPTSSSSSCFQKLRPTKGRPRSVLSRRRSRITRESSRILRVRWPRASTINPSGMRSVTRHLMRLRKGGERVPYDASQEGDATRYAANKRGSSRLERLDQLTREIARGSRTIAEVDLLDSRRRVNLEMQLRIEGENRRTAKRKCR